MLGIKNKKIGFYLLIYTVLVLLSGVVIGKNIDCDRGFGKRAYKYPERMMSKLTKALELSEFQQDQLRVIIDEHRLSMGEMREAMHSQFKLVKDQRVSDINAILNSDQQVVFAKLREKHERKFKKKGKRRYSEKRGVDH